MNINTLKDLNILGQRVIVRCDFNVPLNQGEVENDKRLRASLSTIQHLIQNKAKIILMSHLGRPKGKIVEDLKMAPVAKKLSSLLNVSVSYVQACIGDEVFQKVEALEEGQILLLENLRFYAEEEENDIVFAEKLATLADVYINDAFGTAHRAHASTEGIANFFDEDARGIGTLIEKELQFLGSAVEMSQKPFVAIIGGAKISSKIDVIESLAKKVDKLIIGGGMAYTFLKSQGLEIGDSLCEDDKLDLAVDLLKRFANKIVLPKDAQATAHFDFAQRKMKPLEVVRITEIPQGKECVDIGPQTQKFFSEIVGQAKTVFWNGPMGVFEVPESSQGTFEVAKALVIATQNGATTIVGGGDSAAAVEQAGIAEQISHVSTGGGASLEFLEGKKLPGIEILKK